MNGDINAQKAAASLDALRDRFLDTLEYRLLDMERVAQAYRTAPDVARLQELATPIHKLAGVAASFGYSELSTLARAVDARITQGLTTPVTSEWNRQTLSQVEHLMDSIERVIENDSPFD